MQEVNVVFNPHYFSSGEYVKIAFVMPKNTLFDFFSVTFNKATNHIETQRKIGMTYKVMKANVFGRGQGVCLMSLEDALKDTTHYDIYERCCLYYLNHACCRFFKLASSSYSDEERETICNKVHETVNAFNGITAATVATPATIENSSPVADVQETEFSGKVRKFIRMAKIVNAENLSNVVAGNFYPVLDEKTVENRHYYTIDVNGNPVSLRKDRIKIINVYTEAPA